MMDGLISYYPLIKSLHLIFVIFWMAALFMMPRFLAYHMEYSQILHYEKHILKHGILRTLLSQMNSGSFLNAYVTSLIDTH